MTTMRDTYFQIRTHAQRLKKLGSFEYGGGLVLLDQFDDAVAKANSIASDEAVAPHLPPDWGAKTKAFLEIELPRSSGK